jgi:hypothetical protein
MNIVDEIQEGLDAAIAQGDRVEASRLGAELLRAQTAVQESEQVGKILRDATARTIRRKADEARTAATQRGDKAVRAFLADEAPEITVRFGPIRVVVRFNSADGQTLAACAEAVRRAAMLTQIATRERVQGIRAAAMENKSSLGWNVEQIKRTFTAALEYSITRGLTKVTVKRS